MFLPVQFFLYSPLHIPEWHIFQPGIWCGPKAETIPPSQAPSIHPSINAFIGLGPVRVPDQAPFNIWFELFCRKLFFNLEILPLPSQYILSLLLFMIKNRNQFLVHFEIYYIDTMEHANFHQPFVNLTKYQKGVNYQVSRCLISFLIMLLQSLIIPRNLN